VFPNLGDGLGRVARLANDVKVVAEVGSDSRSPDRMIIRDNDRDRS